MKKEDLWDEIKFEINSINKSKKLQNEEILIGSGSKNADILFIGDDSNLYESENLNVKIGSSGEFLIKLCDIAEILPEDYYITTLSKCTENFRKLFDNDKKKLKEILDMQIALINPKIIVAFGQDTAELLLERDVDLKQEHGAIINWKGNIKLIISYDVSFAKKARESSDKKSQVANEFWKHIKAAKKLLSEFN